MAVCNPLFRILPKWQARSRFLSAAHNLSSSVAHKLSGLKITREVIRDETNDSVTGGQEDEI